jgi:hypothetical protein
MVVPRRPSKVYAYTTNQGRLLVFNHPLSPEAGVQVPGGTVKPGEDSAAVLREAWEETGLSGLEIVTFLGGTEYDYSGDGRAEIALRRDVKTAGIAGIPPFQELVPVMPARRRASQSVRAPACSGSTAEDRFLVVVLGVGAADWNCRQANAATPPPTRPQRTAHRERGRQDSPAGPVPLDDPPGSRLGITRRSRRT